ncbi:MAG TPA: hypothetical protein VNS46_18600 [Nocardioides sp.]|nr:hypothetical protein [Nocardioides sp.]
MTVHRIVDHELSLSLPRHWPARDHPAAGIVLEARSPVVPASGFVPRLVLRTVALDDLPAPSAEMDAEMDTEMDAGVDVEDAEEFELSGHLVGYARLGHRSGATDVVTERWTWVVDDTAVVLSGTVARVDYADYCDVLEDVAATVEIRPTGARPGSVRLAGGHW